MDYANLFRLDGKSAVVIGAGSGIGRESARALAAHGARVTCADRDGAAAEGTAELIGDAADSQVLDVLDTERIASAAHRLPETDVLVFTAATNVRKRLVNCTSEEFERVLALNLRASFELVRAFAPAMAERRRGSIIGFSSIRASTVEPGQGAYSTTKAGLIQLLRTAAAEYGGHGVRANAVAPGVVETPLTRQITDDPGWYRAYAEKSALARWSRPEEMAGAVVYLASEASSFVTGSVLTVDGGWTAVDGRFDPPE